MHKHFTKRIHIVELKTSIEKRNELAAWKYSIIEICTYISVALQISPVSDQIFFSGDAMQGFVYAKSDC